MIGQKVVVTLSIDVPFQTSTSIHFGWWCSYTVWSFLLLFSLVDILVHGNIISAFRDDGSNEKKRITKKNKKRLTWASLIVFAPYKMPYSAILGSNIKCCSKS